MQPIRQQFSVPFTYEVRFTVGLFQSGNPLLADALTEREGRRPVRTLFVIEDGGAAHHPTLVADIAAYAATHRQKLDLVADPMIVPGGEQAKNDPDLVRQIQQAIADYVIWRHSHVGAIGGGALLDLAGYAAATAHRCVRHIRVPTTVLAQNDSGVGVKNGVNAFNSKNFLGTFAPPQAVLNDRLFLRTLDDRDWRGGISEAIKVALIKEAAFFDFIEREAHWLHPSVRADEPMQELIYRCAEMHVEHISAYGDPFETGSSRPLDFGHWAAHKLEALTNYDVRHGEAVAIGISLDCVYAHLAGYLAESDLERILATFEVLGFDLFHEALLSRLDDPAHSDSLYQGLEALREHLGGQLTYMLLNSFGDAFEVHEMDHSVFVRSAQYLRERALTKQNASNVSA